MALIYIDRITERHKTFVLNSLNIHRYFFFIIYIFINELYKLLLMSSVFHF